MGHLYDSDVSDLIDWGNFPKSLRRWYIAQNGRCAYCGRTVELRERLHPGEYPYQRRVVPSSDHVRPRSKRNGAGLGNKVLACAYCNKRKADRPPRPCEIFFAHVTAELVVSMLPPTHRYVYYRGSHKPRKRGAKAMSSLEKTDQEAAAVAKTPNRVPLRKMEDEIDGEYYTRLGAADLGPVSALHLHRLSVVTICVIVFKNGFVQIGQSAPADPENFNTELGRKFAREDAIRKSWPLFGFALCDQLHKHGGQ